MQNNLHIYPSPFKAETRINKETRSLIDLNLVDRIDILGYWEPGLAEEEEVYPGIWIHRIVIILKTHTNKFFRYLSFLEFMFKAMSRASKYKANIVNCHSLHVLPLGVWLKVFTSCKLVYDTHELETEVSGSKGILRIFAKSLEFVCMPFVDEIIVVSDSIGEWYKRVYNLDRYTSVYNIPSQKISNFKKPDCNLRKIFSLSDNDILFIYQGILSNVRGVSDIITAFQKAEGKYHIVFMGYGPLTDHIIKLAEIHANIHFHPPVPSSELLFYSGSADAGIHIIKNTCLNHFYCLPNKIFEYLLSGIPFIVSNFPEMGNIVNQTNGGWLIEPSAKSLLETIERINPIDLEEKRNGVLQTRLNYGWEIEEKKFIPIYNRLRS